jgi:hypothetical protein
VGKGASERRLWDEDVEVTAVERSEIRVEDDEVKMKVCERAKSEWRA